MAHDDSPSQADDHPNEGESAETPRDDRQADSPGRRHAKTEPSSAQSITTSDPEVEEAFAHQSEWSRHPDSTLSLATTQVGDPPHGIPAAAVPTAPPSTRRPQPRSDQGRDQAKPSRSGEPSENDKGRHEARSAREEDRKTAAETHSQPLGMKNLAIIGVMALVCGIVGAFGYSHFFGASSSDNSSDSGKKSAAKKKGSESKSSSEKQGETDSEKGSLSDSGTEIPGFSSARDADSLKKQIEHLSERIDLLSKRLDSVSTPKDETPPVLRTLQIKVGEMATRLDDISNLPSKIRRYDQRLDSIEESIKTLREKVSSNEDATLSTPIAPALSGSATASENPTTSSVGAAKAPEPTLDLGVALFQQGRYAQALEIFRRMQQATPLDARVWYYSALANGLTTGVWNRGETKLLVEKGVQREQAGTPSSRQINGEFSRLTTAQGKDWLSGYRRLVAHE